VFASQGLWKGAAFIVASELMFASMGAGVKLASQTLPNEVIVFLRNAIGLGILLPWLLQAGLGGIATRVAHLHLLRALAGVSAMYCFFYALAHLPLADGMLLKMTAPIFMPLIAWLWLRESATALAIAAVPVGFLGVGLVLKPDGAVQTAALIGLLGGLLAALAKVTVRRLTRSEPTARIVFYFAVLATLVSAVPMAWAWRTPNAEEWVVLGLIGLGGTLGQILLTRGYAAAPAARVSPFTYFSVVFAAVYGYLFWGETLDIFFVAGAALIAAAGLLALVGRRSVKPAVMAAGE
jgi:drug/metabolite transporter (DMT)-like permease